MNQSKNMTLEQQRAQDAWRCSQGQESGYVNLAKGLPALIMNSGLMQVLAYLQEKGLDKNGKRHPKQGYYLDLAQQLRDWLKARELLNDTSFPGCMNELMTADPHRFQQITTEAFAWLRWLRQISAAVIKGD